MKKLLMLALALILILSCFSGCDNEVTTEKPTEELKVTEEPTEEGESEQAEAKTNEYGWVIPDETIKFSVYNGEDNPDDVAENYKMMHEYLISNFNVDIDLIVYDTDLSERVNLMLAAGDYPDVVTQQDSTLLGQWKELEKVVEVTELAEEYAPTLIGKLKDGGYYNRYLDEDGKLWGFPRGWGLLAIPDYCAHIRWDWWQEIGAPEFITPEEYYEVIKQMQALHPTNSDGDKTYAFSAFTFYGDVWFGTIQTIAGAYGLKAQYQWNEDGTMTNWINTDAGIKIAHYFNQMHLDGLMDPDAFINTFDDFKAKFSSERVIGYIGSWWVSWNAGHEVWQQAWDNWTDDSRFVQVNIKADEADVAYLSPKNTSGMHDGTTSTIITDDASDVEGILKWFDFEASDLGIRLLGWGVPNNEEHSVWNFDGTTWSWNEEKKAQMLAGEFDYSHADIVGQTLVWNVMPQGFFTDTQGGPDNTVWYDQNFNNDAKWKKYMNDNLKDTIYDNTAFSSVIMEPEDEITIINQQLKDLFATCWANVVFAESADACEAAFYELRDTMNAAGLHDLEEFYSTQTQANIEAWK